LTGTIFTAAASYMRASYYKAIMYCFAIMFMALCCAPAACCQETPQSFFQKAEAFYKAKNYAEALPLYQKVIAADSLYVQAYRGIVLCYGAMGNPHGALKYMDTLFLEKPGSAEVHYGMGCALYGAQKYDSAASYFDKAIKIKPELAAAWNNRGSIYHFVARDYAKARQYYEKAIETGSRTGNAEVVKIARENIANLPREEDFKSMSLEDFLNAFIARADESDAAGVRWLVLGQRANCGPALDWLLEQALQAASQEAKDQEKTFVALAMLLAAEYGGVHKNEALKKRLAAYTGLSAEQKKKTFQGNSLLARGVQQERQAAFDEAAKDYSEALACFQAARDKARTGLALLYLGDAQRGLKKYSEARTSYADAETAFIEVNDKKQHALTLTSLGFTSALLKQYAEAIEFFNRALKIYISLKDEQLAGKVRENISRVEKSMGTGQ
jgi:tetratricopeptide (TPR) repeat protein